MDSTLTEGHELSVMDSLPLLRDVRRSVRIVQRDGSGILAHGALLPHRGSLHGVELHLGVIGGMATRFDARNRGLGTSILEALEVRAAQMRLDFLLLWPNGSGSLYSGHGYEPFGREWSGLVVPPPAHHHPAAPGRLVRLLGRAPTPDLELLRRREAFPVVRSREDWCRHLAIPALSVFGWIRDERLVAYAVQGKGADLTGHVHEVGGDDEHVFALVTTLARHQGALPILLPPWRGSLADEINSSGGVLAERPLCLGKVLNRDLDLFLHDVHLSGLDSA